MNHGNMNHGNMNMNHGNMNMNPGAVNMGTESVVADVLSQNMNTPITDINLNQVLQEGNSNNESGCELNSCNMMATLSSNGLGVQ